jgi:outer membrane protein assembly factor BamB
LIFNTRVALGQVEEYYAYPGTSRWVTKLHVTVNAPAFGNGLAYFPCTDGIYALSMADGHVVWHNASVHGSVAFGDGNVYITDGHALDALSATTGTSVWHYSVTSTFAPNVPATVTTHAIFLQPANGHIYAFNPATGAVLWNVYTGTVSAYPGTPIEYQGYLYTIQSYGQMVVYLASNGKYAWSPGVQYLDSGLALLPAHVPAY